MNPDDKARPRSFSAPIALGVLLVGLIAGSSFIAMRANEQSRRADREAAERMLNAPTIPSKPDPARDAVRAEERLRSGRAALWAVETPGATLKTADREARLTEAIAAFTEYLKHRPKYAPVLHDRARAYDLSGRIVEAVEDYEAAASADPALARNLIPRIAELRGLMQKQ
jgi:tetratricopeptide (TPR) repeat protein